MLKAIFYAPIKLQIKELEYEETCGEGDKWKGESYQNNIYEEWQSNSWMGFNVKWDVAYTHHICNKTFYYKQNRAAIKTRCVEMHHWMFCLVPT